MQSLPHTLKAEPINSDSLPTLPLPVEMLVTPDQRRTSRTAPDEIEAVNREIRRLHGERDDSARVLPK